MATLASLIVDLKLQDGLSGEHKSPQEIADTVARVFAREQKLRYGLT